MRIVQLRREGASVRSIAKMIHKNAGYVSKVSREAGIFGNITQHVFPVEKVKELLNGIGFDYVDGFAGTKSTVTVRCQDCGGVFRRRFDMWFARQKTVGFRCPICLELNREEIRKRDARTKEERLAKAENEKAKAQAELISRQEMERLASHVCKNCGKIYCIGVTGYNSVKYCSEKCMKRWAMRVKSDRRINKMRTREHDNDITLEKLFKRDNGVCYLCGGQCDWDDLDADGNAQDLYPSIDHVLPISKGGKHKWDNIKLAHRRCNWQKRDEIRPLV